MVTNVGYANRLVDGQASSTTRSVGRFLWHFVQMLVTMMVGMMIFHAFTGRPSEEYRVLWFAGMEVSMIPPMIALMLYQRHGWRYSLEMAGAMMIGPAVFLACAQFGWHNYIPGLSRNTLFTLADVTMFLGMLGGHALSPRNVHRTARTSSARRGGLKSVAHVHSHTPKRRGGGQRISPYRKHLRRTKLNAPIPGEALRALGQCGASAGKRGIGLMNLSRPKGEIRDDSCFVRCDGQADAGPSPCHRS